MNPTRIHLHTDFQIGAVSPRLFGGFLEHLGRAVYGGVYDPQSEKADSFGFRSDVLAELRRLRMTVMRYPGGNFASGYHWRDGIGPVGSRPAVLDLAWNSKEPNLFGTDEFIKLCRAMDWEPMLTANLGTGSPEEARDWVEYCNSPAGTRNADMRAANGAAAPHGVKLWCLGNEMDGEWQLGHVSAAEYARRAQQAAKMMKNVAPNIELVVCGSCGEGMATYMDWDRQTLECIGDFADYISLHRYVGNPRNDTADYLAVSNVIDRQIEDMAAACRFVQAKRRSRKHVFLCFDEWNVWYKNREMDGKGAFAPALLEEIYNFADALVTAEFLMSFIRHADWVKIANLAQIVNVIAPIVTRGDELLVQSIFYPFEMVAKRRNGVALRAAVECPWYESHSYGPALFIDSAAVLGEGRLHFFALNRCLDEKAEIRLELAGASIEKQENGELLTAEDPKAANSFERRDAVAPRPFNDVKISRTGVTCKLPELSFAAMSFKLQ